MQSRLSTALLDTACATPGHVPNALSPTQTLGPRGRNVQVDPTHAARS